MATNKQQLQLNNTNLQSILSTVLGLPTQESVKHGTYVWKRYSLGERLPSGYTELEYIQSSGTQYIDTGYYPTNNTKIVADAEYLDSTSGDGYPMLCGEYVGSGNQYAIFFNSNSWKAWFGSASVSFAGDYSGRKAFSLDNSLFKVDSSSASISSSAFTSTLPLYLLALKQSDGIYYPGSVKLYDFKIYENGSLVRDYVPAMNSSGVIGLYDLVGNQFYTNSGTGNFEGKPSLTFEAYSVSDEQNKYPDGGTQDGYWYERFDSAVKGIDFGEVTLASSVTSIPVSHSLGTTPSWAGIVQKNTCNVGMLGNMNGIGFARIPSSSACYDGLEVEKTDTDITFYGAGTSDYNKFNAGTYCWFAIAE